MLEQIVRTEAEGVIASYFESIWFREVRAKRIKEMEKEVEQLQKNIAIFKNRVEVSELNCSQIAEQYKEVLDADTAIKSYIQRAELIIQSSCIYIYAQENELHPERINCINLTHQASAVIRYTKEVNRVSVIRHFVETRSLPKLDGEVLVRLNELIREATAEYAANGYPEYNRNLPFTEDDSE